jgi:DNA-directed RNA polymerase subunit beta
MRCNLSKYKTYRERVPLHHDAPNEDLPVPNLLDLQVESFQRFLKQGIEEELKKISPIVGYGGKFQLEFLDGVSLGEPELDYEELRKRELTYASPLKASVRLISIETGEVQEQEVFLSDIPLMTNSGTFLVNGTERVIVSQFIRSPGVYFREKTPNIPGFQDYIATIIPSKGAWLEIEVDSKQLFYAHLNKVKKVPLTLLLSALGYTEDAFFSLVNERELFEPTLAKFPFTNEDDALIELHKGLRSGDPVTLQGAKVLLESLFFNDDKYDLSDVGRYKINQRFYLNSTPVETTALVKDDIVHVIRYICNLVHKKGLTDDIDHLGNRRVRTVGEQLQRQFRIGLVRLERLIKEQMALKGNEAITPQHLINIRPLVAVMREFFGSSQLSQFLDQTNPLAEVIHKRRLSALGPGGLTKERAGYEVRDIHPTHYGRICPIETPEGPNAGLIGPMATFARVNPFGFIETPYYKVKQGKITKDVDYLAADVEENFHIAPWDSPVKNGALQGTQIVTRYQRDFSFTPMDKVQYIGVSPRQLLGVACGLIPFLEHDDANRALMGANMQRQAVPIINPEAPYIGTGLESVVARDTEVLVTAKADCEVVETNSRSVTVQEGSKTFSYDLQKYQRTNQNTCRNQKPVVYKGMTLKKGDLIADGSSTTKGELSLGRNILVGFMPWEGYNFEDAIVISKRLVKNDIFTSVHIHRYEIDVRTTKLGHEELTSEIPNISEDALSNLDEDGIVRIGAMVSAGDILVGKVTPKGESEPPAEEKLLRAIFGDKARDMKDTSLRVSSGESGKVIGVRVFSRDNGDDLSPGVNTLVRVYVAQLRKVSIGDKMAGRHGNKGVVSTILPEEDMPFLPNGQPLDIILNPLGVPSRMNVGQLFETLLGMASHIIGENYMAQSFDEVIAPNASVDKLEERLTTAAKMPGYEWVKKTGTVALRDGRTGEPFEREVTVGYMYVLKLIHLVDDKIHARSTGPYSLVTQQPLGGKAQYGGQRFGEMEVWALEAYGAANTLQEMLTVKSDDLTGRARAYEAIIKGKGLSKPGTPESFRVLLRELRSIALDIRVKTADDEEIDNR